MEGRTELLGDIVIICTGGQLATPGASVVTANFTVALSNTVVTSRTFSNGLSEALLLVDEPGATGVTTGSGIVLPQVPCSTVASTIGSVTVGAGPGGCATFANTGTTGIATAALCTSFSATTGLCTTFGAVPNVFQGQVNGNQVVFNGIPILAPVSTGASRVFRITNVRADASAIGTSGSFQGTQPILASISISSNITLTNPVQTAAFLFNGLGTTALRNTANNGALSSSGVGVTQCNTAGLTQGAVLRFPEGFAAAFKTRFGVGAPSGTSTVSSVVTVPSTQNSPGQILPGSESGFIVTPAGVTAGSIGGNSVGVADFGTRLKATFTNVPAGVNVFVSTTNINPAGNTGVAINTNVGTNLFNLGSAFGNLNLGAALGSGGTIPTVVTNNGLSFLAGLVQSETATSGAAGFLPLQPSTNNATFGNVNIPVFGPLAVDASGTATAVWEVLLANPSAQETAEFGVFFTVPTSNPTGNIPAASPAGSIALSFAPTTTSVNGAGGLIPRFVPASTTNTIFTVNQCKTVILFPFVNATPGFDTGIAIANTTSDPYSTRGIPGACKLNFFGSGAGTPSLGVAMPTSTTNGLIAPGTVEAFQVSNLRSGFAGYVIAECDFTLGHGYALFSDTGIRNWATGYLGLVLPTGTGNRNAQSISYVPNTGGVEGGIH